MRCGIEIVPFGDFADPRVIAKFAQLAEEAGWEGVWIWDHIGFPYGVADPWVSLAAAAQATRKIKLVAGVCVLPRYKPHLLWRMITSLDILSSGRLILGAGSGAVADEFTSHGESYDQKQLAGKLDEGLELLTRMWTGKTVSHHGEYYTAEGIAYTPTPHQKPRPPVWIGGESKPARRRAARWDGWIIGTVDENNQITKTPAQLAEDAAYINDHRASQMPFDIAIDGITTGAGDAARVREYEDAGATWYFEILFGLRGSMDELLARVEAGPPG
ncbi:MAG: LLM class flavin-dependent oxidoreductase [Chloroflexota bacterium]|nr:LLM class flavin-dependent oxidoreductase [Chloroflexota bacterium]